MHQHLGTACLDALAGASHFDSSLFLGCDYIEMGVLEKVFVKGFCVLQKNRDKNTNYLKSTE